jgi:hypothetical protein
MSWWNLFKRENQSNIVANTMTELMVVLFFILFLYVAAISSKEQDSTEPNQGSKEPTQEKGEPVGDSLPLQDKPNHKKNKQPEKYGSGAVNCLTCLISSEKDDTPLYEVTVDNDKVVWRIRFEEKIVKEHLTNNPDLAKMLNGEYEIKYPEGTDEVSAVAMKDAANKVLKLAKKTSVQYGKECRYYAKLIDDTTQGERKFIAVQFFILRYVCDSNPRNHSRQK